MTEKWLSLLEAHGWQVPIDETTWCTTSPDDVMYSFSVRGIQVTRAARDKGFKVLGAQVSFNNTFAPELAERIKKAWRAFYKYKDILLCRSGPIGRRIKLLGNLVQSSLFYCAGSWNLKATQCATLRGVQQDMIRKMLRIKRHVDEDIAL